MTYQQTLDYLFTALPMFSRIGAAAYKKDLTNTIRLCEALGNPHQAFRTVHVGGTNGKGSVSHMLAAILQESGHKTGLYTSPHLYDFRERIRIDGSMMEEDDVVRFVQEIGPLIESIQPSFFEITVAMAFHHFAKNKVDIAVIEVGLGGRLDSTNIITPEVSVITNIGWDHMNMLGDSLEAIAAEKAGIIKPGVPTVIGQRGPQTDPVFEQKAAAEGSPLYFAEDRFTVGQYELAHEGVELTVTDNRDHSLQRYRLDLGGIYQTKNLPAVLQAAELLGDRIPDKTAITSALEKVKSLTGLSGRWEIIHQHPSVVLEVAHNPDGIQEMLRHLEHLQFDQLHIVLGMVKDKDPGPVLSLLPKNATYYFTHAHIPRALEASALQEAATPNGLHGNTFDNVNDAISNAMASAAGSDLIIVCGSIFLVAEVDKERVKGR